MHSIQNLTKKNLYENPENTSSLPTSLKRRALESNKLDLLNQNTGK